MVKTNIPPVTVCGGITKDSSKSCTAKQTSPTAGRDVPPATGTAAGTAPNPVPEITAPSPVKSESPERRREPPAHKISTVTQESMCETYQSGTGALSPSRLDGNALEPCLPSPDAYQPQIRNLLCGRLDDEYSMPRSKVIYLYTVALPFEYDVERDMFREIVYKNLFVHCADRGYHLEILDHHWAMTEENIHSEGVKKVCLSTLEKCQDSSVSSLYLIFFNEKIGMLKCPQRIQAEDFDCILSDLAAKEQQNLLNQWYRLDNNHLPPSYCLQPIRKHITKYGDPDGGAHEEAMKEWEEIEEKLVRVLYSSMMKDQQDRYFKSGFESELEEVIFTKSSVPVDSVIWIKRTIKNKPEKLNGKNCRKFSDICDATLHNSAQDKIQTIKSALEERVSPKRQMAYTLPWADEGVSHENKYHEQQLISLSESFEKLARQLIDGLMETDREQRNLSPIKRIHSRLHYELLHHTQLCQIYSEDFYGQENLLNKIQSYIISGHPEGEVELKRPLVISGEPGSGKSALVAMAIKQCQTFRFWENAGYVYRFCGSSPESRTLEQVIHSCCEQICLLYGQHPATFMKDIKHLPSTFPSLLQFIPVNRPLLIVLDGLDHLQHSHTLSLSWIMPELPNTVRMILTLRESNTSMMAELKEEILDDTFFLTLSKLDLSSVMDILCNTLVNCNRTLTKEQREAVESAFETSAYPINAKVTCRIVSQWKDSDSDCIIPKSTKELVLRLFELLEAKYGSIVLVALRYVSAAKCGLTDTELNDLVTCDKNIDPTPRPPGLRVKRISSSSWRVIFPELDIFLQQCTLSNGVSVWRWKSDFLGQIFEEKYGTKDTHRTMLDYFEGRLAESHEDTGIQEQGMTINETENSRYMLEVSHHLIICGELEKCRKNFFDYNWLHLQIGAVGIHQALADISKHLLQNESDVDLVILFDLLVASTYALACDPSQLFPQLYMRTLGKDLTQTPLTMGLCTLEPRKLGNCLLPKKEQIMSIENGRREFGVVRDTILTGLFRLKGDPNHVISVATKRGEVKVWNIQDVKVVRTLKGIVMPRNIKPITQHQVAILCNREIKIYNLDTGCCESKLKGILNVKMPYYGVHDDNHVVALSRNRMYVNVMNIVSGDMAATFKAGEDRFLNSLVVSGNGKICVCGDEVQKPFPLLVWDLGSRKLIHDLRIEQHEFITSMTAMTHDGHFIACISKELEGGSNFIIVYDLETGQLFKKWKPAHNTTCVAISSEAHCVVTGAENGALYVWDLTGGQCKHTLTGHSGCPDKISLSDSGEFGISYDSTCNDRSVRLWDVKNGLCVGTFIPDDAMTCCEISPDGSSVIIGLPGMEDIIVLRPLTMEGERSAGEVPVFGDAERQGMVFDLADGL
ncbi:NACHT and WD repeat domain-containing protein 2-like isoform X3 [Lineus longissimus]